MNRKPGPVSGFHLSPEDFANLVLPSAGLPPARPDHISACSTCARQLDEWRRAVNELRATKSGPREDFERDVMSRVRKLPAPTSSRFRGRAFSGLAAAAALVAAFLLGGRYRTAPPPPDALAHMLATDRADDELLRDVSRLVDGEDPSIWKTLAPLPEPKEGNS